MKTISQQGEATTLGLLTLAKNPKYAVHALMLGVAEMVGSQGLPNGHLYAHLMPVCPSIDMYETLIAIAKKRGVITESGNFFTQTPKGAFLAWLDTPITDLVAAQKFLELMILAEMAYHLEDDPSDIEGLFNPLEAILVAARVAELYALDWTTIDFTCPIDYMLSVGPIES